MMSNDYDDLRELLNTTEDDELSAGKCINCRQGTPCIGACDHRVNEICKRWAPILDNKLNKEACAILLEETKGLVKQWGNVKLKNI